jgi:mannose-6-phosphate isomerase-like protein (cupin superfamily)
MRTTILTTATDTQGRFDLTDNRMPPHATEPLHLHTRYEEHFYVLSGALTVMAGKDTVTLQPGDYYAVPMNVPHVATAGPDGAHALLITSPAGFAELIERTATPAHLATGAEEFPNARFLSVTTELGDVILDGGPDDS